MDKLKKIFDGINIVQEIGIALIGGFLLTAYSLISNKVIITSEGFFSLYQKESYTLYGFPWPFLRKLLTGSTRILYPSLFYTIFFYSILLFILLIVIFNVRRKKKGSLPVESLKR